MDIMTNFNLKSSKPLDTRLSVNLLSDITSSSRYEGMIAYQINDKTHYKYIDGTFVPLNSEVVSNVKKHPTSSISLTKLQPDGPKTGIKYLTKGWHDNVLYGHARTKLFRAANIADPTTWEMGVDLFSTYGVMIHMHVSNKGIVMLMKATGANVKVWYTPDIFTVPTLRHEFILSPTTDTINGGMGASGHSNGVNDYLFAVQYGFGLYERKAFMSTDLGQTWTTIYTQAIFNNNPEINNHIHAIKYDPFENRIWIGLGDSENSGIVWSDDMGVTWNGDRSLHQPTLIHPFAKRVAFGRDSDTKVPGIDEYYREDYTDSMVGFVPKSSLNFREDQISPRYYPSMQITGFGDVLYIIFYARGQYAEDQYIYATGDGGSSWHLVFHSSQVSGQPHLRNYCSQVTADGKLAFVLNDPTDAVGMEECLVYCDALEWVQD